MNDSTWNQDRKFVLEMLNEIREDVKSLKYDLDGNGKPGLKDQVRTLLRDRTIRNRVIVFLLTTMATAAGGWMFTGGAQHGDGAKQEQHGKP